MYFKVRVFQKMYFKVHGCVLFWTFLLKMHKCSFIRVFEIRCCKNYIKSLFCKKKKENMCRFYLGIDHVLGLSISPEICPNQHFLGVTNLRYFLLVPCPFFANFPRTF
jgi:hypothetical protein